MQFQNQILVTFTNKRNRLKIRYRKYVKGCRFKSRCPYAIKQCDIEPNLEKIENEHFAACHVELN